MWEVWWAKQRGYNGCSFDGTVTANDTYVGGIAGYFAGEECSEPFHCFRDYIR